MAFKMAPDDRDDEHCHCHHVVELKVKVSIAQWMAAIVAVAVLGLVMSKVGELVSLRISTPPAPPTTGPRLFEDRAPEHQVQHQP
jgi:hypothetical protein